MSARSKARRRALDILFESEQRDMPALEVIRARREKTDMVIADYSVDVVEGVLERQEQID